ncbi:NADH-quinone oxidoreductase subunit NuoK [Sulfuracidifex metallicus]|uniref:NADH-quinone oxidoreductase subunit K n=1 Tax=Sulfuracidifex metallicus DSM 6482 = JCM 9184 TaxID=523847 RepID=A0A6A9QGM3_SULME|nr:NADH-quinone oxidoreductase subunit K [Sulfuracidifex metallicus]MCY0850602.1 NADH-quinone oxidoreductase subunit K [Sulfuracidifex metallicus]MUN28357.1 NADH-quinone oxidoreductase subunit K [Sulfuracidifex metallicus DSM 6482 = JCM 9184]WOE51121.1 NADH-quinone oxidoreductase subunit K [Sulfuracidifex metallicus DSM 6482 = JCM 9184]
MILLGYMSLSLSIVLVAVGLYGIIASKNVIRVLLSSEIILNASILFLFSVSLVLGLVYKPIIFSVFAIGMALTEVVVAFAAIILYYRQKGSLEVD